MLRVGIGIPVSAPDSQPGTAIEFARRAEMAGVDSVWTFDRLVFNSHEALVTLASVAATTSRVRLGTSILLAALRPPVLLAKMVATLDQISGGRVTLGIGVGNRQDDFAGAGVPFDRRGSRVEELVHVMKMAWSGEPIRHSGRFYSMEIGPVGPRPVQRPHPPVWFGGSSEAALRRIARIGDGHIAASSGGPEGVRASWETIRRHAESIGRDPSTITRAALVYACVDDDRDRAVAMASRYFANYYGPHRASVSPWYMLGPADDCVRMASAYVEAGIEVLIIGSVTADLGYLDRLLEKVVPRVLEL